MYSKYYAGHKVSGVFDKLICKLGAQYNVMLVPPAHLVEIPYPRLVPFKILMC